jgi:hypothetical protein
MPISFMHLFRLTLKGISAMAKVGRRFEVSTSIAITHQLTLTNGRGKKLEKYLYAKLIWYKWVIPI